MPFKNILVGLDVSHTSRELTPGSVAALSKAQIIAGHYGAKMTLFHSTADDEFWDPDAEHFIHAAPGAPSVRPVLEAAQEKVQAAGLEAALVVTDDRIVHSLVHHVQAESIDLVVVGKVNYIGTEAQLGTVASKLVRKCPAPVWAVKLTQNLDLRNVLGCTDLTPCGDTVVQRALAIGREWGAVVHLLHAFQIPFEIQHEGRTDEYLQEHREEVKGSLAEAASPFGLADEQLSYHIGAGAPTQSILEAARKFEADLVVMGSIGRSGIEGALVGNTAERLLWRLPCSLLVIKPDDFVCPIK